ncbi:dihydroorotase [Sulfuriflexus sp.]|uniref:dihydroorotase n=1 Tax=Sulfuriflexus sp. TaxID=2015443 RepID=UPI0028CE0FDE|nr:dihydroorotase [Sulfuriflexus sp.]MDT8404368.1 dihydroorotase [Sulfuriflexus sp.]
MQTLTLTRPDDWHLHVRDDSALTDVVPHTARQFARAIIMPNLKPAVTTVAAALAYRERILAACPPGSDFQPLMTLYLTDNTSPEEIARAAENEHVHAVKLYPAGATTHSDAGVSDIGKTHAALSAMQELGLPLLIHGEATDPNIDVFDREAVFIHEQLLPLLEKFPTLKIVLEHITTGDAADFVLSAPDTIAATITAHHLLMNRNAMFTGGIRPHHYCLPILKREEHREVLIDVATSGNRKFFLGTDSAPHAQGAKESACGCAGMYTAHAAIELYAEVFEAAGRLEKLEAFASFHGADFYGLPRNSGSITLACEAWRVPDDYPLGQERLIPLRAGQELNWRLS